MSTYATCPSVPTGVGLVVGVVLTVLWLGQAGVALRLEFDVENLLLSGLARSFYSKLLDHQSKQVYERTFALRSVRGRDTHP